MISSLRSTLARSVTFATSMLIAGQAWAINLGNTPTELGDNADIRGKIIEVVKQILTFMALIAVVIIIIAGIRLILSQGDEGEKDKAKKTIIYVIIGLVVIVLARALVGFLGEVLGFNAA